MCDGGLSATLSVSGCFGKVAMETLSCTYAVA